MNHAAVAASRTVCGIHPREDAGLKKRSSALLCGLLVLDGKHLVNLPWGNRGTRLPSGPSGSDMI